MKYIRTKDGRIAKFGEQTDAGYEKGTFEVHNKAGIVASHEPIEVLKQADTIEELCDCLVLLNLTYSYPIQFGCTCDLQKEMKREILHCLSLDKDNKCFGAIWTDKGLIYVAKMNDKGELELL